MVEWEQQGIDKGVLMAEGGPGKGSLNGLKLIDVPQRILSFKPRNYADYLLLSCHFMLQRDFYSKICQHGPVLNQPRHLRHPDHYPVRILFSEFVFSDQFALPVTSLLSCYDIVFMKEYLQLTKVRILKLG